MGIGRQQYIPPVSGPVSNGTSAQAAVLMKLRKFPSLLMNMCGPLRKTLPVPQQAQKNTPVSFAAW